MDNTFPNVSGKKYWFVRTDSGHHFETFYEYNFIGIGWNVITLDQLKNKSENENKALILKEVVSQDLDKDHNLTPSQIQSRVTTIFNKIKNFNTLSKGDIIVIPSYGSYEFAFGIVDDEKAYESNSITGNCNYKKRRKIQWIKRRTFETLDAKFAFIRKSIHSISEIDETYYDVINNTMYETYINDNIGNISMRIQLGEKEDVDYNLLKNFIDDLIEISKFFDKDTDDVNVYIKLNLQSPGFINLKCVGIGLILAYNFLLTSCNEDLKLENIKDEQLSSSKIISEKEIPEELILKTLEKGRKLKALTNKKISD